MDRDTYGKLGVLTFGLVLLSFVLFGFSRTILPDEAARLLAIPTVAVAAVLVVVLFGHALLVVTGIREFD